MTPEQIQTEVLKIVCARFLNLKQSTPRKGLVVKFQNPDVISEVASRGLMRGIGSMNEQSYLPNATSFALSGDADLANLAKASVSIVLRVLKNMFEVEVDGANHSFADLVAHAKKMYDVVDEEKLRLGLYLAQDFHVFSGWGGSQDSTEVTTFSINESIIKMKSPENQWEELVKSSSERKPMPNFSAGNVFGFSPRFDDAFGTQQECEAGFDWNLLHPLIREVAESRFRSGHFADSVEAALKAVNERVREIVKQVTGVEMDGSDLMNRAFSVKNPVLKMGDESNTGKNMQVGYMQIFAGSMTGTRNPKAHGNIVIDEVRATHFLFLASLLMSKIDEGKVLEPKPQVEFSTDGQSTGESS